MTTTPEPITARDFLAADGLENWRIVGEGACLYVRTGSLAESVRLVQAISDLDRIDEHPPALDVRKSGVTVRLITVRDDYYGPSRLDLEVAQRISGWCETSASPPIPGASRASSSSRVHRTSRR